jgi:hypothetical protein
MSDVPNSRSGGGLALAGAFLFLLGPLIGIVGAATWAMHAFAIIGTPGITDMERLGADIGSTTYLAVGGFGLGLIGMVMLLVAIFGRKYRGEWLQWFLVVYAILMVAVSAAGVWYALGHVGNDNDRQPIGPPVVHDHD